MRSRAKPTWKLTATIVSLVLVTLSGLVVMAFQEPTGPKQVLPDGTVLELVGVTYGADHELFLGNWWQRTAEAARALLEGYFHPPATRMAGQGWIRQIGRPWIRGNQAHCQTEQAHPVLWFRVRPARRLRNDDLYPLAERSMTKDSHGCLLPCVPNGREFRGVPLETVGRLPGHAYELLAMGKIPIYSRRTNLFEYRLYGERGNTPLARFTIVNPASAAPKEWRASPPPVSGTDGGVTCTLERLRPLANPVDMDTAEGWFRFTDRVKPGRRWLIWSLAVRDTTGNTCSMDRWGEHEQAANVGFPGLCRREPAWKAAMTLVPDDFSGAQCDHVVTLRNLPVAPRKRLLHCSRTARVGGVEITATGVHEKGTLWTPGIYYGRFRSPGVFLTVRSKVQVEVYPLAVTDDRGRRRKLPPILGYLHLDNVTNKVDFDIPPLSGARFDLTVGVTRLRKVELLVKPGGN